MNSKSLIAIGVFGLILLSGTGIFTVMNKAAKADEHKKQTEKFAKSNMDLGKEIKELKSANFELKEQNRVLTNALNKLTQPPTLTPVPQINTKKEK